MKEKARQPTLRDVAALANVDPSVVSRVLNDDPALSITPETRARVVAGITELDYRPNLNARGLRLARTWTIGFVIPDLTNPVYAQIVQAAQRRAQTAGYAVVLGSPLAGGAFDPSFTRLLRDGRFDAILVASSTLEDEEIRNLADGSVPIATVNRRVEGVERFVVVDDEAGSRLATQHLLDLGHRTVAHIGGPQEVDTFIRRQRGFEAAVAKVAATAHVEPGSGLDAQTGFDASISLLTSHPDVTGIFAANVMMAIGAIRAANALGRDVPRSLSVVSLHDFALAEYTQPPLTTVAMPLGELGSTAIDLVISLIEGQTTEGRTLTDPGRLIVRRSTGPFQPVAPTS